MAKFPALPLFTDAFISDTIHLNAAQTGAYLMLLMTAWRSVDCSLPDDDKILARMARMDGRAWVANKQVIMSFWKRDENQRWYQGRLVDERKYVDDVRHKNVEAGRASALKRKGRDSTTVQPKVNVTSTPTPTPIDSVSKDTESLLRDDPKPERKKNVRTRKPASFIDEAFEPDFGSIALANELDINLISETRQFIDYWKSRGESRADWQATFRNRLRQVATYRGERQSRDTNQRSGIRDVTGAALRVASIRSQQNS